VCGRPRQTQLTTAAAAAPVQLGRLVHLSSRQRLAPTPAGHRARKLAEGRANLKQSLQSAACGASGTLDANKLEAAAAGREDNK
jgi:hypothetical protein